MAGHTLRLDIKKNFFTEGAIRQWKGRTREAVESPSLVVFKEKLMWQCRGLVARVVSGQRLVLISEVFSKLIDSMIV